MKYARIKKQEQVIKISIHVCLSTIHTYYILTYKVIDGIIDKA